MAEAHAKCYGAPSSDDAITFRKQGLRVSGEYKCQSACVNDNQYDEKVAERA